MDIIMVHDCGVSHIIIDRMKDAFVRRFLQTQICDTYQLTHVANSNFDLLQWGCNT